MSSAPAPPRRSSRASTRWPGTRRRPGPGYPYRHAGSLFDVTSGNNDWFNEAGGASCGDGYLCIARPGYDAPTGLGTPDGTGAF